MTICIAGSIAYDYLMTFPGSFKDHLLPDQLEKVSLSFLVDTLIRHRGGTAPNIAYTLALLGDHPLVMATVGEDFEEYRLWLESKGVDTTYIRMIPGKYTASFFANTDQTNAQIASFYPGAMAHAAENSIYELKDAGLELVVVSPDDPLAMEQHCLQCVELGIPYLYDPSQQVVRLSGESLRKCVEGATMLFCNEYEFELLQKHTRLSKEDMLCIVKVLVVTLGANGSCIYTGGESYCVPCVPPKQILDPTGVGDAYRGGFLRGQQLGLDWDTCGRMGALAATYCLEQRGTQNHSYTIPEFIARYREHFNDGGKLDVLG
jgi:adenosine kinase